MIPQGIGQVDLKCSNGNSGFEMFCLKNILYMPEIGVNLISQRQIYWERFHLFNIIDDGICIDNKNMFAHLIEKNLYIMDVVGSSRFTFSSINDEILGTWYV